MAHDLPPPRGGQYLPYSLCSSPRARASTVPRTRSIIGTRFELIVLAAALACPAALAQQASTQTSTPRQQVTARRPVTPKAEMNREHPLVSVLDYARREQAYLR